MCYESKTRLRRLPCGPLEVSGNIWQSVGCSDRACPPYAAVYLGLRLINVALVNFPFIFKETNTVHSSPEDQFGTH